MEGTPPPPVCLVTGASRGLGAALAGALAQRGALVVLGCRDRDRGEIARREVAAAATGPDPELLVMDLADQSSIRTAAGELLAGHDRLDVLVNNAAVFARERRLSADGHELMFATNHLGAFLLTNLLLDAVARANGRVLTVTAPSTVAVDFDDLQGEQSFKPLRAFGASKMANLLFTRELARRGEPRDVTAIATHPGLVRTDLMRDAPAPLRWATGLVSQPPAKAAASIVPVALDDTYRTSTGELLKQGKPVKTNDFSRDPANQQRLWAASCALTGIDDAPT